MIHVCILKNGYRPVPMVRVSVCDLMRARFICPDKNVLRWFPGHMGKGMKQMEQSLKSVDCVVEVHDARIPLIGRNAQFKYTITGLKPYILVLNKKDLADSSKEDQVRSKLEQQGIENIIYTDCKAPDCSGLNSLVPKIQKEIVKSPRFNRSESEDLSVMIVGIPNVGKSSLINALRNRFLRKSKAAPVGAVAGITRSLSSRIKISQKPLIYVLDTPGILDPKVDNADTALKLALCSSMQDHLVGIQLIADYLLYYLNKTDNHTYVDYLGLKEPTDDITELLVITSSLQKKTLKARNFEGGYKIIPDLNAAAYYFVKAFRSGVFGRVVID